MGCFLGCFGGSKDVKRRKQRNKVTPRRHQRHGGQNSPQRAISPKQVIAETQPINSVPELSRTKSDEQLSLSTRKKVTFDSKVTTYEHVSAIYESTDSLLENNKLSEKEKEESLVKPEQLISVSEDGSITSSVGSYPPNHRYQNCRDSDDEAEEFGDSDLDEEELGDDDDDEDYGDFDEDGEIIDRIAGQEVWSESVLTASMESKTAYSLNRMNSEEVDSPLTLPSLPEQDLNAVQVKRNYRDRSIYVHPVLNPVENLTQWKTVKKGTAEVKSQKENFATALEGPPMSLSPEPTFKQPSEKLKVRMEKSNGSNQEIAVDASLSNWLADSTPLKKANFSGLETVSSGQSMSQGSNSVISLEDRPILGALTVEELKQFSATSSPRRSPSRSPDEMPIIGTVGTYWNHMGSAKGSGSAASSFKGIPNTTSKYREDKRVTWHSTPFETRLERALNHGKAEV